MDELDQAQLLQLALEATRNRQRETAISVLKQATSRADATAQAHYLLGAEYAQIQLYERAIGEIEAALALDATLHTAKLQLALLYFGASKSDMAILTLASLVTLPETDPLHHFGKGLMDVARSAFSDAKARLAAGIALNNTNSALNVDMQRIIDAIDKAVGLHPAATVPDENELPTDPSARHIFLMAYGNSKNN